MRATYMLTWLVLAAGCSGSAPSPEKLAKLKLGMSQDEVESVLGAGRELNEAERSERVILRVPATWKAWGSTNQHFLGAFHGGKFVAYRSIGLPDIGDPEENAKRQQEARARGEEFAKRSAVWPDLNSIHTVLVRYAKKHNNRLPATVEELGKLDFFEQRAFDKVKDGTFVIRWGLTLKAEVFAYETAAPEQGGYVLKANGEVVKMTAAELQAVLAKNSQTKNSETSKPADKKAAEE